MDLRLLQDRWKPSNSICLINCSLRGDVLKVGLAWFNRQIELDFITVSDIDGGRIDVIIPDDLKRQKDSIIRVNTTLEIIK